MQKGDPYLKGIKHIANAARCFLKAAPDVSGLFRGN